MNRLFILLLLLCITKFHAVAQENVQNHVPNLDGHYFVPVNFVTSPFTNSHFAMNLGIASSSSFENIVLEIDGETIVGLKGSLVFADLHFDYQQRIKEWIAFFANVGLTARIGTEVQSMLTQGVNTVSSFQIGWLAKLVNKERYMLSGTFQVNNYGATFINISDFVEKIVKDSTVTSITRSVPILNGSAGLSFAYAFNTSFGFQGNGEIGYGESFERGVSDFIYRLGCVFDANLNETTKVPLGFAVFYTGTSIPSLVQVKGKSATNTGLRISFTGGPHFNLGLELSRMRVPIPNVEEKVNSATVLLTTKYYFN